MDKAEKEAAIKRKQEWINSLPYQSTIPYPFCCMCFTELTADNILEKDDGLWDVCLECKDI